MTVRTRWAAALFTALLLLLATGFLSSRLLKQQDAAQQWVSHTQQVMEKLDDTLTDSVNLHPRSGDVGAETSSQPDSKTLERLQANLSEIKSLTADNPRQQRALLRLAGLEWRRGANKKATAGMKSWVST